MFNSMWLWLAGPTLLIVLVALAVIPLVKINSLALPISSTLAAATTVLPILAAIGIPVTTRFAARARDPRHAKNQRKFSWLAIAVPILFTVYETIIATLSITHIASSDEMLCGLDQRWAHLYTNKDKAIKRIQDAHECCGLRTTKDRVYPFPEVGKPNPLICVETFKRDKSCLNYWMQDEQKYAGLLLLVAIVVFLTKFTVLYLHSRNVTWFDKLLNHRRIDGERSQGLLTGAPDDAEEADHEDDATHGGRQLRYRDDPNTEEEDADEEVVPTHYGAGNGNSNSSQGRNRGGPTLEVSGLAPGGNEWAR